jgi:mRNA interferase MazF
MSVERGEIYFVSLDPIVGCEMGGNKTRPVVVLSINDLNRKPLVVTIVPGTTVGNKPFQYRNVVVVPPTPTNGLSVDTMFLCHQIRAIDHSRFKSQAVGRLEPQHLQLIEEATRFSLGLL